MTIGGEAVRDAEVPQQGMRLENGDQIEATLTSRTVHTMRSDIDDRVVAGGNPMCNTRHDVAVLGDDVVVAEPCESNTRGKRKTGKKSVAEKRAARRCERPPRED